MLRKATIAGATYPVAGEVMEDFRQVNYVFGHNGSGKTTISRVIANPVPCPGATLVWANGRPLETLVYNCDFAQSNFGDQMRGIFTLGEESNATAARINELDRKITALDVQVDRLRNTLQGEDGKGGKRGELVVARDTLRDACWESQKAHKDQFGDGFSPHRQNKVSFCEKLLGEHASNSAELRDLANLRKRAATVFGKAPERERVLSIPSAQRLEEMAHSEILGRHIVGRDDIDVARLIKHLGNSDWVKRGVGYARDPEGPCPFCQQTLPHGLLPELEAYFDAAYETDLAALGSLSTRYAEEGQRVTSQLRALLDEPRSYLDVVAFRTQVSLLEKTLELNWDRIEAKRKEPSIAISLEPVGEIVAAVRALIEAANAEVMRHNAEIDDRAGARNALTAEIWRFVLEERKVDIATWAVKSTAVTKAIEGIEAAIKAKGKERGELDTELRDLKRQVTSVRPTVDAINRTLASFGFSSFRLDVVGERSDMYRIVRSDGSDAARTLSEGERSFITFLYFYYLLSGSTAASGTTGEKVVVFDDPVSSLDADVLFIVGALVRKVVVDACEGGGLVRQVFVLTHNIYFHKEVSFSQKRTSGCLQEESFWVVRKRDNVSSIKRHDSNPVRTSYELLWEDVRNGAERVNDFDTPGFGI
jgi:wobble nucleotide-excising tRNase